MQYQQRYFLSTAEIYRESASKKNGITLRRIRKVGVLTLFKKGTRKKISIYRPAEVFYEEPLWFPQILVIISGAGI